MIKRHTARAKSHIENEKENKKFVTERWCKKPYRYHKLLFAVATSARFTTTFPVRGGWSRIWTLWYRSYRSYPAAGKLCYRLCQRVSVPRCTLRRHYARFICLLTFLLFYMSCDPTARATASSFPFRYAFRSSTHESPFLSHRCAQEIEIQTRV